MEAESTDQHQLEVKVSMTCAVVGGRGIRDLSFFRARHIEGGAHLLSLAALPSLKRTGTHLQLGEMGDCTEGKVLERSPIHLVTTLDAS